MAWDPRADGEHTHAEALGHLADGEQLGGHRADPADLLAA
jgi:hypothetical protein